MQLAKAVLLTISMTAVMLSGCTSSNFSEDAPEWKAGYTWSANYSYEEDYTYTEAGEEPEHYNDTYEGSLIMRVANTTGSQNGIPYYLTQIEYDNGYEELAAFRQTDLARLWVNWNLNTNCFNSECTSTVSNIRVQGANETPTAIDFPLTNGKAWSFLEEEDGFEEDSIQIQHNHKVTGQAAIETDLGKVRTIVIESSVRILNLQDALNDMRKFLEEQGFDVDELSGDYRMNSKTYYSPDYMIPMKYEQTETERFVFKGSYEGESFDEREEGTGFYQEMVTGASLVAGAEVPMESLGGWLAGNGGDLPDPTGQVVEVKDEDPTYSVSIDAIRDHINAADNEAAKFKAVVDGDMPADHTLVWKVLDLAGSEVSSGDGMDFETRLPSGVYGVGLLALDEQGGVVSVATHEAIANYETEVEVACGVIEVLGTGVPDDCDTVNVPVNAGVSRLNVVATPGSLASAANEGRLEFTDSRGDTYSATQTTGDPKEIDVRDFGDFGVTTNTPWALDYEQTHGVMESVTLDISVRYDNVGAIYDFNVAMVPPVAEPPARLSFMDRLVPSSSESMDLGILATGTILL